MGWTSSADQLENVGRASLFFYTKEEAISFCDKHGWPFTVTEPNARKEARQKRFTAYADNFRCAWRPACQAGKGEGPGGV